MGNPEDHENNTAEHQRQGHPQGWRQRWRATSLPNRLMVIATGIIAVATIVNLGIAIGEWRILGRQLDEMAGATNFAERQAILAIGQLATTNRSAGYIQQQAEALHEEVTATQKSTEAVQRQTFQQERPWIAVDIAPASDFTYDENSGGILTLKFTLTNVGHSLAKYVSVWADLAMNEKWPEAQERICAIPKASVNAKSDYGYLMFPGQIVTDAIPAGATPQSVKQALATTPFQGGGVVSIDVVVCVDYKSSIDERHHQTKLVRSMSYPSPTKGMAALMGAFAQKQKYGQVILLRRLHGDSAD